ncbi:hypothetical protein ABPG77_009425 [Micractinium sp. CCAP 211/92]
MSRPLVAYLLASLLLGSALAASPHTSRRLLQGSASASASAIAQALGSGSAAAAAQALAKSDGGSATADALSQAITDGQGTAVGTAAAEAVSQAGGSASAVATALAQAISKSFEGQPQQAIQPVAQALGAVQDAGVQAVTSNLCSQLAQLATTALYNEDANAARLIAAAFIQGGTCAEAIADSVAANASQLGCAKLVAAMGAAYQLVVDAGAQDAFLQTLADQAALLVPLRACLTHAQLAYGASMPSDDGAVTEAVEESPSPVLAATTQYAPEVTVVPTADAVAHGNAQAVAIALPQAGTAVPDPTASAPAPAAQTQGMPPAASSSSTPATPSTAAATAESTVRLGGEAGRGAGGGNALPESLHSCLTQFDSFPLPPRCLPPRP